MKERGQLLQRFLAVRISGSLQGLQAIKNVSPFLFGQVRSVQGKFFEQANPAAVTSVGKNRDARKTQGVDISLDCTDRHGAVLRQFLRCLACSVHQEKNDF